MTKSEFIGGGMSRAAKRRAKQKKKQSQDQQPVPREKKHTLVDNSNDESTERIKKPRKHMLEAEEQKANSTVERKKKLRKQVLETEEEKVESTVHSIVSKLTPAKILQMQELDPQEDQRFVLVEQQEISVSDFLKQITTRQRARALFQSILGDKVSLEEFYELYWEQKPLYVSSDDETRLDGFLSKDSIRDLLETYPIYYGRDLNVTRYEEGIDGARRRITLDPQPDNDEDFVLVNAKDAWANFGDGGCTLRLLCPHKHNDALHSLLSTLEWEWGCMVGANVYLTPPAASQGFAPHYDDIEAFCLQLEGYKHWKVYAPLNKVEILPRESSQDYTEEDLKGVEPVLDVVLGPGDLLYMPRGWIHQACTTDRKGHSLHLTVSAMQQWSWVDYLELLLPEALEAAAASDTSTSLREGLPLGFLDYMGAIYDEAHVDELPDELKQLMDDSKKDEREDSGEDSERSHRLRKMKAMRENFREEAKKRIMRVSKEALSMLDAACDQMGKRFISDRLPPAFTAAEIASTSESRTVNGGKIFPNTLCRLVRPGIARLALEEGRAVLYHCVDNSRVYQGNPLSPMEFEVDDAPALELLLTTVEPRWIQVQDLIHDDIEEKMEIAQTLYDEGILSILQMEKPDRSVQVG